MSYFDESKFQKKLKKKMKNKMGKKASRVNIKTGGSGGFYFLGFLGSAIYFIGHSTDFWSGVLGFLKAIVWPVFLVYEAFAKLLG
jgi:hypothetical protein